MNVPTISSSNYQQIIPSEATQTSRLYKSHPLGRLPNLMRTNHINLELKQSLNNTHVNTTNSNTILTNNSNNNNANGNKKKRSWSRAVFSNLQRKGLEMTFKQQKYITKPERKKLADRLRLTDAQVKVWFQNRRMKDRQTMSKEIDVVGD